MFWALITAFITYKLVTWLLSHIRIGDYQSKYVVITGCDSGFGNLMAKHLDSLGFSVFAACLKPDGARELHRTCSERVTTLLLDVTDVKSIASAQQFVESRLPSGKGLWGLVNNAGITGPPVPSEWQTHEDWVRCLSVNLFGVINTTRVFMPLLRKDRGRVVNMSSIMGRIVAANGPYCVSKYGVEAFSDCLRRETYNQGIKVCIVEPGYFKTPIINMSSLISAFEEKYNIVPDEIRKHYPNLTKEKYIKLVQKTRDRASDDVHLVVNAMTLALTSRFPPTRQLVGIDARFIAPILWSLPAPLTDWIMQLALKRS